MSANPRRRPGPLTVTTACLVVALSAAHATQGTDSGSTPVRFVDVTEASGIRFHHERAASIEKLYPETMGAGVAWLDFDTDGWLDAFFVNSGVTPLFKPAQPPQPALYRNNGDGTFTDVTARSGIESPGTFFFGVATGDIDNDGDPDLYLTGYRHSVLYLNKGDGTFVDATATAKVANDGAWGTAAGFFDYDRDGRLDLLVTNYVAYDIDHNVVCGDPRPGFRSYCHPDSFPGTPPKLFHNLGAGTFEDVTARAGLRNPDGKSLAVVLADLDEDGWTDIFIANDTQRNFLYFNKHDGTFEDVSYVSGAGFSEDGKTEAGMSADAADTDGDGRLDLYVSHLDAELNRYYTNLGSRAFVDATVTSGLGATNILNSSFGARFVDWDNDGWRDLLVVNGHILDDIAKYHSGVTYAEAKKLYRNVGRGRFVDVSSSQPESFLAPRVGRGLAVGDYDNDGDPDFLVNNNGEPGQLFRNDGGNARHWLGVRLVGTKSARDAIGARLVVRAGALVLHDQVKGGMSYCSAQDPRVYFGLDTAAKVDALEIVWPSGDRQTLEGLPADTILTIEEGRGVTSYKYPVLKGRK
ncbi:MAG: CRTAC1 family protein [Vicinamibacterales bacterium]